MTQYGITMSCELGSEFTLRLSGEVYMNYDEYTDCDET
jgi:hypothetical protein